MDRGNAILERFGNSLVLLDKLAAGGMAEVYRAKQLGHGGFEKIVAVKRILPQYAESEDFKEMFLQEASLSAHLQHPNVVQTYSNGEVGGYLYLTMEYVDGKNLRQILAKIDRQKKRIPIEVAIFTIAEAAKGLHYAHDYVDERSGENMNIVHRDMSPQNVMLGYDGTVRIVDFGIAKMAAQAESTRAGVLKGKFGYMSPEQARGMQLDRRTDVFALGIILFELLTQRRLFASDDDMRTLRLVKECRVPRPSKYNPSIGPQLDHIALKALAKEKSERYATAHELYEDLQRLMQELYPRFISSDFSKFMKTTFVEEIREEKLKREKLHREAPAILDSARYDARVDEEAVRPKGDVKELGNATVVDDDQATQVSNVMESVEALEVPEVGEMGSKTGYSHSAALGDPRPPRITELQFDSPIISDPRTQLQSFTSAEDLPPSSEFAPPQRVLSTAGPSSLYVEITPTRTNITPPLRSPKKNHAKIRRLAYVSVIMMGVMFYISQEKPAVNDAAAPVVAVAESGDKVPAAGVMAEPPVDAAGETPTPSDRTPASPPMVEENSSLPEPAMVRAAPDPIAPAAPIAVTRQPGVVSSMTELVGRSNELPGYLSITSYPRADRIIINGEIRRGPASTPLTGPIGRLELPPGKYEITLQNSTYGVSWQGTVIIRSQRISPLEDVVLK